MSRIIEKKAPKTTVKTAPSKADRALTKAWESVQNRPLESAGRFEYRGDIPPDIGREIFKVIEPLEWLMPPWCYTCLVGWNSDANDKDAQGGAAVSCSASYEYRHMCLTFYPSFFDARPPERRMMVIHDLLHCVTKVFMDYAREEIERLLPDDEAPKYRGAVLDELTRRHEAMTQDLARLINERL